MKKMSFRFREITKVSNKFLKFEESIEKERLAMSGLGNPHNLIVDDKSYARYGLYNDDNSEIVFIKYNKDYKLIEMADIFLLERLEWEAICTGLRNTVGYYDISILAVTYFEIQFCISNGYKLASVLPNGRLIFKIN